MRYCILPPMTTVTDPTPQHKPIPPARSWELPFILGFAAGMLLELGFVLFLVLGN